jgi:hypothetical protein
LPGSCGQYERNRSVGVPLGLSMYEEITTMLLTIISSTTAWISQVLTLVSNQITNLQPSQYAIGLVIAIGLGYVMLRGRN